jgi:hypothetical protein
MRFILREEGYSPKSTTHFKAFKEEGTGEDFIPPYLMYEYNDRCLKFDQMPKLSSHTKISGVSFYWFHTKIINVEISVKPIVNLDHLADQFTKGLAHEPFEEGHMALRGWRLVKLLISSIETDSCDFRVQKMLCILYF